MADKLKPEVVFQALAAVLEARYEVKIGKIVVEPKSSTSGAAKIFN